MANPKFEGFAVPTAEPTTLCDSLPHISAEVTPEPSGVTLPSATSLPVQAGVALRRRFQKGTLIIRGKTPMRCGIFRDDVLQLDGTFKRVQRCVVLGPVKGLSERAA